MRFSANYKRDTRGWVYNVSSPVGKLLGWNRGLTSLDLIPARRKKRVLIISQRAFLRKKKFAASKNSIRNDLTADSIGSSINKKIDNHISRDPSFRSKFEIDSKGTTSSRRQIISPHRDRDKLSSRAQFTVVVHRYGVRSVAVERPPRKNDHRAP